MLSHEVAGADKVQAMTHARAAGNPIDQYQATYESEDPRFAEWRRIGARGKATRAIGLLDTSPSSLADIGCGDGALLVEFDRMGCGDLYGWEVSQSAVLRVASLDIPSVHEVRLFDGYTIDAPDRAYDVAILAHVLEHAERPHDLLAEAGRVARTVVLEVPLEDTLLSHREAYRSEATRIGHIQKWNLASARRMVQAAGMRIERETLTGKSRIGRMFWASTPTQRAKGEVAYVGSRLLALVPPVSRLLLPVDWTCRCGKD